TPTPGRQMGRDVLDDRPGDVHSGGALDALEAWRGVHLKYQRTGARSQQIDTGDLQSHDLGGAQGGPFLSRRETNPAGLATPVQVGAELPGLGLAVHRRDHAFAYYEATDVGTGRFADEFLHEEIRIEAAEGFDDAARRRQALGEHD